MATAKAVRSRTGCCRPRSGTVPAGKRYPVILDIHGGPHTEFGNSFFHEFQVLAARGYIVVYANPRGSVGYGYDWSSALDGNWGDAMFADETAVMDEVVKRPDVDPARTFVSGGSYGGYATLWRSRTPTVSAPRSPSAP